MDALRIRSGFGNFSGFTGWSLVTIALAVPVWLMVFWGSVLSREFDGGIFLSIGYGLADGLDYYVDLWDNKDPFFGVFMAAASHLSPAAPFFMDLLWIPLASLGVYLLARSAVSGDRALFLSLVVAPFILVGPSYVAGWTHTPGTALVLLGWGLLASKRWVLGGLVIGLLLFVKITVWPIALLGLVVLALWSPERRQGHPALFRTLVAMATMVGISIAVLGLLGWLPGLIESIRLNSSYASTLIAVFGYEDSVQGHLSKLMADSTTGTLYAALFALLIAVTGLVIGWRNRKSNQPQFVLPLLLVISIIGTAAVFALTYLWPHHIQAMSLPLILGAITLGSLIPEKWGYWLSILILVPSTFVLSGWGSISALSTHVEGLPSQYQSRVLAISEEPVDAFMLNTLVDGEYTYARLGTNDDRGFLGSVREGATLGCPYFHLYDFSPVEAFAEHLECLRTVDVILVTNNFEGFANSMNRVSANNLLGYVNDNFLCTTFQDRKLCTRR